MTIEEKIAKTVQLYQAVAYIWGAPTPFLESVHFVDPEIFHTLPDDTLETHRAVDRSILFDLPHVSSTVDTGSMMLRLYCGHNEECPLLNTKTMP
jgi:hypothetical protein